MSSAMQEIYRLDGLLGTESSGRKKGGDPGVSEQAGWVTQG